MPGELLESQEDFKRAKYCKAKFPRGEILHAVNFLSGQIFRGKFSRNENNSHDINM